MSVIEIKRTKKKKLTDKEKIEAKKLIEEREGEDSKIVKGVFKILCGGGKMSFSYKKYKDENTKVYSMEDGQTQEIPLGLAKHINSVKSKSRDFVKDAQGNMTLQTYVKGYEQRYQFISTEFE